MAMIYFKYPKDNSVWAYEHDVPENEVKLGLVKITEEEAEAITNPPPTKEQLIEAADYEQQSLITEANQKTQLWQTQLMLGIITDEDKISLTEWMRYVQKVQAVDTSTAPDIIWPEKPE